MSLLKAVYLYNLQIFSDKSMRAQDFTLSPGAGVLLVWCSLYALPAKVSEIKTHPGGASAW